MVDYRLAAESADVVAATAPPAEQHVEDVDVSSTSFTPRKLRFGKPPTTQGARTGNYAKLRAKAIAGRKQNVQRLKAARFKG